MTRIPLTRMTEDFRVVIPDEVRAALELSSGDMVVFELLEPGVVKMKKADEIDHESTAEREQVLADEWMSGEDDKAYSSL